MLRHSKHVRGPMPALRQAQRDKSVQSINNQCNHHKSMKSQSKPFFAPILVIPNGTMNVDFYINGLGAKELRRFSNDDGSIHVSELAINGALFHLHEEGNYGCDPKALGSSTCTIGLFVDDVDAVIVQALIHGATERHPARDYEYGYRQGQFIDPFGHVWEISKAI